MGSARRDFAPRQNWRDHRAERRVRQWQAATSAAARDGFLVAALICVCMLLGAASA